MKVPGRCPRRLATAGLLLALLVPSSPARSEPATLHHAASTEMMTTASRTQRRKPKRKATLTREAAPAATAPNLTRAEILATDPAILERLGRHIVIGYHSFASVKALVEKKAIAGVFVTDHNVFRRRVADIRAEIDLLQSIRKSQKLPPLIVAADQEGGAVSRLSPPLPRQPGLARVMSTMKPGSDAKAVIAAYARKQASELKRVGVNLNFSPVVDLKIDPKRRSDGQTQLRHRALSADPKTVSDAAGWYCDALAEEGVYCTIKHFPGLGRVTRDTHRHAGDIKAPLVELKGADWVPFRTVMDRPHVLTMLAHVRLRELDDQTPASFSTRVIDGLIRTEWKHEGLLITDDLSMGAVTRAREGVGGAALKALNAGADLILVSFSDRHLDTVMTALIRAEKAGAIDAELRQASLRRLKRVPPAHKPFTQQAEDLPSPASEKPNAN